MTVLPDSAWRTKPGLSAVIAALGGPETTRLVGGVVRDGLRGLPVNDIDMATRLRPDEVMARLEAAGIKAIPTGIDHGTVTAVSDGSTFEITTLRRDVATDGRHATIAYTGNWQEDAARRDFTINALFADPDTGDVFDWFGGVDDLNAGIVRFIGVPVDRIAEDHLRILRFFRFHARFGRGAPDVAAYDACAARANDLMALSRERIADELLKLLATPDPAPAIGLILARDILKPVIPEITDAVPLARIVAREHEFAVAGDPVRRLAALIGQHPATAADIAARLRLSKAMAKRLVAACTVREPQPVPTLAYRVGSESARDALLIGNGTRANLETLENWQRPTLPISGGGLIARGLEAGPRVAQTLRTIEEQWIAAGFPTGDAFETIVASTLGS